MNADQVKVMQAMKVPDGLEEETIMLLTLNLLSKLVTPDQFHEAVKETEFQINEEV